MAFELDGLDELRCASLDLEAGSEWWLQPADLGWQPAGEDLVSVRWHDVPSAETGWHPTPASLSSKDCCGVAFELDCLDELRCGSLDLEAESEWWLQPADLGWQPFDEDLASMRWRDVPSARSG